MFNKDLLVNSKETGGARAERGKEKVICWVLLPVKTFSTKEAELTNSFAYTALASQYIMSRLLTKALKNRDQQPPCIASEHLEIVPHADRMINSSELQLLLHNTQEKKGKKKLFSLNLTHIPNYSSFKMGSNIMICILRHLMLIFVTRWILWMHVDI